MGPPFAAKRACQVESFKRKGKIKAFYFAVTMLDKDILLVICQVFKKAASVAKGCFSVQVWENTVE